MICFFFRLFTLFSIFFSTSNFFGPSTTDETSLVEMRIWCIKIGIVLVLHDKIQVKFEFGFDPLLFPKVMVHGLREISRIISFPDFFLSAYRYSFDIWYIALPYQDTDQVWVWFWSIDFSRSYGPWTWKKDHDLSVLGTFFLIFIWYLVHCFAIPRYRLSLSLALIHWFFTKLWPLDLKKINY